MQKLLLCKMLTMHIVKTETERKLQNKFHQYVTIVFPALQYKDKDTILSSLLFRLCVSSMVATFFIFLYFFKLDHWLQVVLFAALYFTKANAAVCLSAFQFF